ncbi:uncharacterized protein I206_105853 [Kwoniella pini CBS 10737]|uniref:E3 ubiquitin-protein ligase NRDP1 n=1 Tax=Kwoniella pini CBS 10737 TaxID=1296096 RepID=A0A1B9I0B5_9TREE|nr:uncharacterized protein I206_04673 [Kwoniella pini CBS 10737]OCF48986.1 hypothetical protein I206_04673 [Kwoniella pini CBS 10737]
MSHEVIYNYVESIDPNLTCAICQSALVDPVTTTSCKHTFCRDCITRAIIVNPQCPIDRSALSISSLKETEQLVKLMLDELKVSCAAEGCGSIMERGLLLSHLRNCTKAIITCKDGNCGLSMARHRLPHHRAYECFQRRMECEKCGTVLVFKDRSAQKNPDCCQVSSTKCELCDEILGKDTPRHHWICPKKNVACPHGTRGCPAIIARSALQTHLDACPFEALSGFFEQNDARLRLLEQRNETLQAEIDLLKVEMQSSDVGRAESWNTRHTGNPFGFSIPSTTDSTSPWLDLDHPDINFSAQEVSSPSTPTTHVQALSENNNLNREPRLAIPANQSDQSNHTPTTPNSPSHASPQTQAAYPGVTTRAAADLARQRSMVIPTFGSHQSYADWTFNRLSSSNMPNIQDAIHALRDSVCQLAGGLDTMERRNEVRTMTESLRVLEEVGGLRAIVTTMRMQVMMSQPPTSSVASPSSHHTSSQVTQNNNNNFSPAISIPFSEPPSTQPTDRQDEDGEPVTEDSYLDPERSHSIRESHAFSRIVPEDARSSTSSLITAYNAASRNGSRRGRTIGSGAGLTGRTMAIPPPGENEATDTVLGGDRRNGRLSRANPMNLIRRQPSRFNHRPIL